MVKFSPGKKFNPNIMVLRYDSGKTVPGFDLFSQFDHFSVDDKMIKN